MASYETNDQVQGSGSLDAWIPGLVRLPANISRVLVVTQDPIPVLQRTARVSGVVNSIRGQMWLANVRLTAVLM